MGFRLAQPSGIGTFAAHGSDIGPRQANRERSVLRGDRIHVGRPGATNENPSKYQIMYVPNHLKWRILLARELKLFYFERENSHRNCKRIFELYGRYLLGTTYDTFLNYLNQLKYEISGLKLPSYIIAAVALLEPLRIACERIRLRKATGTCSLLELAEEMLEVLRSRERERVGARYPTAGSEV